MRSAPMPSPCSRARWSRSPALCRSASRQVRRANIRSRCSRWSRSRSSSRGSWRCCSRRFWECFCSRLPTIRNRRPTRRPAAWSAPIAASWNSRSRCAGSPSPRRSACSFCRCWRFRSSRGSSSRRRTGPNSSSICACRRTPRSTPARTSPNGSTRRSRATRTSKVGALMSGAAPSASICRSTCSCRTISSRRRSLSRKTWRRANACA